MPRLSCRNSPDEPADRRDGLGDAAWPRHCRRVAALASRGGSRVAETISDGSEKKVIRFRLPDSALKICPSSTSSPCRRDLSLRGGSRTGGAGRCRSRRSHGNCKSNGADLRHLKWRCCLHEALLSRYRGLRRAIREPVDFSRNCFQRASQPSRRDSGNLGRQLTLSSAMARLDSWPIKMAEDLMADGGLDYCLVVGAEEADWLLCDAYRKWRLLRSAEAADRAVCSRRARNNL